MQARDAQSSNMVHERQMIGDLRGALETVKQREGAGVLPRENLPVKDIVTRLEVQNKSSQDQLWQMQQDNKALEDARVQRKIPIFVRLVHSEKERARQRKKEGRKGILLDGGAGAE